MDASVQDLVRRRADNRCEYCLGSHTQIAIKLGWSREQLDDLAFVVKLAQLAPKFVVDSGVARHSLRKFERSFFSVAEVGAVAEIRQVVELLLAPAMPPCQGGVRGKSILAVIELRGANDRQLLQLRGYSACVHDRAKVRDHGAQDLRPVRGRAEHVGHIAALLKVDVVDLRGFRVDLIFFESRNTRHGYIVVGRGANEDSTFSLNESMAGV